MWVVRDADSTIYITGTVHILPSSAAWRSERLDAALNEASELWLEIAEIAQPGGINAAILPILAEDFPAEGVTLSSLLTDAERERLAEAYKRAKTPPEVIAQAEISQPSYAIYAIDRGNEIGGDYSEEYGIDRVLADLAVRRGIPVKGLETLEFQMGDIYRVTPEEQLAQLRWRLADGSAYKTSNQRVADLAYGGWTRGETNLVEALARLWGLSGDTSWLLADRNENWAEQIEEMLAGAGISFIAVGAMHLVGPDSLQHHLKLRGIKTERY